MWPPPRASPAADAPSPSFSRPRLVKHRKHGPTARGRAAPEPSPAFNPFRQDASAGRREAFPFGTNESSSSGSRGLPEAMGNLRIDQLPSDDADAGGHAVQRDDWKTNPGFVFGESSREAARDVDASLLPEDMRKLRIGEPRRGCGDQAGGDVRAGLERGFVSGSSEENADGFHVLIEETARSDGRLYSGGIASILHEDMKKLNIDGSSRSGDSHLKKSKGADSLADHSSDVFVFGTARSTGDPFDGDGVRIRASSIEKSSLHGENADSTLPDDMKKLDIESSSGYGVGSKVDGRHSFDFGSSKKIFSSSPSAGMTTLPEEIEKLSIGTTSKAFTVKDGDTDLGGRAFIPGSGFRNNHTTRSMASDEKEGMMLLNVMQRLNLDESVSVVDGQESYKDETLQSKGNISNSFAFSTGTDYSGHGDGHVFNNLTGDVSESTRHTTDEVMGRSNKSLSHGQDNNDGIIYKFHFTVPGGSQDVLAGENMFASFMQNDDAIASGQSFGGAGPGSAASHFVFRTSETGENMFGSFMQNDTSNASSGQFFGGAGPGSAASPFVVRTSEAGENTFAAFMQNDTTNASLGQSFGGAGFGSAASPFFFRTEAGENIFASFIQNDTANASTGHSFGGGGSGSATSPFVFRTSEEGRENPYMDRSLPKYFSWTPRDTLFSGVGPTTIADGHVGSPKDAKKYKKKTKWRRPASLDLKRDGVSLKREDSLPECFESGSSGSYSPMDFSPYENLVSEQLSGESSLLSNETAFFYSQNPVNNAKDSVYVDAIGDLAVKAQSMVINEFNMEDTVVNVDAGSMPDQSGFSSGPSLLGKQIPGQEAGRLFPASKATSVDDSENSFIENASKFSSTFNEKKICDVGTGINYSFVTDDVNKVKFSFAAASQGLESASKKPMHKKNDMKLRQYSYKSSVSTNLNVDPSSTNLFPPSASLEKKDRSRKQGSNVAASSILQEGEEKPHVVEEVPVVDQDNIHAILMSESAQEICERWRLRGNQAYNEGNLSKAEEYYSRGVDCVSSGENSDCMRALMLCHSNRAATRMSLGRMRESLADCKVAISIDPNFYKAHLRAANCHLALGETENALRVFKKCLQLVDQGSRKVSEDASEGLQKTQQVEDNIKRSSELLKKRSIEDASNALVLISDALQISPLSERLIEMKANALFMIRRYDEVIKICEQTIDSAEKNADIVCLENSCSQSTDMLSVGSDYSYPKIWRWSLIARSFFYLGRPAEAVSLLEKHNIPGLSLERCSDELFKSLVSFSVTLQELVEQKAAGNNAFQANRHYEAVEHYTAAIACSTESRPFAAICFCNRAAAYQALGQLTDAIADCSLAIALDGGYAKAISRRAALHEMIRDYSQALNDLNRLILLLEGRVMHHSDGAKRSDNSGDANDLKRARLRLSIVEDELRKDIPLDFYMILGVDHSCNTADIKKAYRKAALRHHPDKACQLLTKSDNTDDGLWKEVADEVHKDADRLFKMIGEAYAMLSDRCKRLQYDNEEEMRSVLKCETGLSTTKHAGDSRSSFSRQPGNAHQRSFSGGSQQWRSESSRFSRHF